MDTAGVMIECDPIVLWGNERNTVAKDDLALEALSGWEPTRCGAGVIRAVSCPVAVVHNIVSTSMVHGFSMPINLQRLAMYLPSSSYNRRRFAAITIRIDNPRCTALLFTSGKLVITGVRSWYEGLLSSLCIARIVTRALVGCNYFILNCEVQNIVAHSEAPLVEGEKLDIQRMYDTYSVECTFQKNMFPGLIYRGMRCPVVLLCFCSGKVVLTGAKTMRDIEVGWEELWAIVKKFIHK